MRVAGCDTRLTVLNARSFSASSAVRPCASLTCRTAPLLSTRFWRPAVKMAKQFVRRRPFFIRFDLARLLDEELRLFFVVGLYALFNFSHRISPFEQEAWACESAAVDSQPYLFSSKDFHRTFPRHSHGRQGRWRHV